MWGNKSHEFSKSLKTCFKKLGINLLNMQYIKTLKTLKISNRKFYQFYESLIFVPFTNLDWKYRRKNEESKYEKNQNVNLEKLEYLKKVLESGFFVNCKKKIQADFFFSNNQIWLKNFVDLMHQFFMIFLTSSFFGEFLRFSIITF